MYRKGRLAGLLGALLLILVLGTEGFIQTEDLGRDEAFYLTITTISTVGYGDVHPKTREGRALAMVLIMGGIAVFLWTVNEVTSAVADGHFQELLRRTRMERTINRLHGHHIVCGYGRMGTRVTKELLAKRSKVVVIDMDEESLDSLEAEGIPFIHGDATADATLLQAGIKSASGIVACLGTDAENVFVTLAARSHSPGDLAIVARALSADSLDKLHHAGANRVISPFEVAGPWLARAVLNPEEHDFLEVLMGSGSENPSPLTQFRVGTDPPAGKALRESGIRKEKGGIVLAIRRDGKTHFNPEPDFVLAPNDLVFLLAQGA